jgi:hypothetical protein
LAAVSWLWYWLRRPWLTVVAILIGVLLALAAWLLPQLPGQLADEQAAAATWLLNTSAGYGIWGNAFLGLGLFHVLHSPLLYLLLALLVPTLAAQLADQLGALRQQRSVYSFDLKTPGEKPGAPIPVSAARGLFRWRGISAADSQLLADTMERKLQSGFAVVEHATAEITQTPLPATGVEDDAASTRESRFKARRHLYLNYLRPLLMLGLLVSVAGAWTSLAFGWQVTAPPLAPGATFRSANRNLLLHYSVPLTNTLDAALEATLQGATLQLAIDQAGQARLGAATLQVRPAYPGIWIATADGGEHLALPGESKTRPQVGLVLADPASEESLLLPNYGAGLRIVQRAGSDNFVLELYRSDAEEPVYRAELTARGQLAIPFPTDNLELVITALPGLQVDVRHLPGLWLVPLGILLALIGAAAFLRSSAFAIVQVAPWANGHSVVTLQSDHPEVIADLYSTLAALSTAAPARNDGDESAAAAPGAA